jgi:hypothetical protein
MLAEYMWAMSVLLLSPSVSSAVVVPLNVLISAVVDVSINNPVWLQSPAGIAIMAAGIVVILLGFFGLNCLGSLLSSGGGACCCPGGPQMGGAAPDGRRRHPTADSQVVVVRAQSSLIASTPRGLQYSSFHSQYI